MKVTYELENLILHLAWQDRRSTASIAAALGLNRTAVMRIIARRNGEPSGPRDSGCQPEPGRPR